MSDGIVLDDDNTLMMRMQGYRVRMIEGIMAPEPSLAPGGNDIANKDPKLLRVALTAMSDVDNSIIKRQRIELEAKSVDNDEAHQEKMAALLTQVLDRGGLALRSDVANGAALPPEAAQPAPQLDQLPSDVVTQEESFIGIENIEYDDIMNKK